MSAFRLLCREIDVFVVFADDVFSCADHQDIPMDGPLNGSDAVAGPVIKIVVIIARKSTTADVCRKEFIKLESRVIMAKYATLR